MKSLIPVAVVGAGRFGTKHVEKYVANVRATLSAVVDPDPATKSLAAQHGAAWFRCVEDLPPGFVRAASIAVPDPEHADVAMVLLRAGVDVLVEKPFTTSLADADALIRVSADEGCVLQVGHVERFDTARSAVPASFVTGHFHATRRAPVPKRDWVSDVVLDLMIHDIDLLIGWTGTVPEVVGAHGQRGSFSEIDCAEATLAFPGGATATLHAARGAPFRSFQVHCDGKLFTLHGPQRARAGGNDALAAELDAFLDAVQERAAPVVSGQAGRAALAVALRIRDHVV